MNYLMFLQKLEKEKVPNLLVLNGSQEHLKEKIIAALKVKLLQEPSLNYQYLNEEQLFLLSEAVETYPFLDNCRLIVYEAGNIFKNEKEEEKLYSICEQLPEFSYLVLLADKLDKKKKIYQLLVSSGIVVDLGPLKNWEMEKWLVKFWSERKKVIDKKTVNYIIQILGSDLGIMEQEMEKMALYLGKKEKIELADAEQILGRQTEQNIFKFLDFVLERNLDQALIYLHCLRDLNQPPLLVFSLIQRELRMYWQIKNNLASGTEKNIIKKELGINYDFIIEKHERRKDNFTVDELNFIWQELASTDVLLKNNRENSWLILEQLLLKIISK